MTWNTGTGQHFLASNPPTGTYGSKSNVQVQPTSINLQSAGVDMSGGVDAGPILANIGTLLPSGGGEAYLPPGQVKIASADANNNGLTFPATANVKLKGAGWGATGIILSQSNLTWGIALIAGQ